jgi:hypothetical protein
MYLIHFQFVYRRKKRVTEAKIRSVSLEVADLERRVREAGRNRRADIKQVLIHSLMVYAGYLHMLLRYSLVLRQDFGWVYCTI